MKHCEHCQPGIDDICDFCKHFDDDRRSAQDGYCNEHEKDVDIEDRCEDFYCRLAD